MAKSLVATVAILTHNGEDYLERILTQVFAQKIDGEFEVLIIDSGSMDSTLEIISRFPEVRLYQIPNFEFGHGKTRNFAARLAAGKYIAFLTHDAVPVDEFWLDQLLHPFTLNERVVAVVGRQIPRANAFPTQKYEISSMFGGLGNPGATSLYFQDASIIRQRDKDILTYYSDVNSMANRDFLVDTIPYRDVAYAEDQLFGRDVIEAGYIKAYAPRAAVEHSNDLTLHEYGKRMFDETVGLRRIGFEIPPVSLGTTLTLVFRGILADTFHLFRDKEYSAGQKIKWFFVDPAFQIQKWRMYRRSTMTDVNDEAAFRAGSLEHSRKQRSHRVPRAGK